jgi:hypothetical protein
LFERFLAAFALFRRLRMSSAESRLAPAPAPLPTGIVGPCSSSGMLARWDMR